MEDRIVVADTDLQYVNLSSLYVQSYTLNPDLSDWNFKFVERVDDSRLLTLVVNSANENAFYVVDVSMATATHLLSPDVRCLRWYIYSMPCELL